MRLSFDYRPQVWGLTSQFSSTVIMNLSLSLKTSFHCLWDLWGRKLWELNRSSLFLLFKRNWNCYPLIIFSGLLNCSGRSKVFPTLYIKTCIVKSHKSEQLMATQKRTFKSQAIQVILRNKDILKSKETFLEILFL